MTVETSYRYEDDVRHITRRWIPFAERGLEDMTPWAIGLPGGESQRGP